MKKITLITVLLLLICMTSVYAAETTNTFNIEVQTDSSTIAKEQKQVTIDLYLKNYNGDGTLGYEGKLEYDKNVFESVTITALNDWDKAVYDSTTGKFVSTTIDAKTDAKIAQITLKLKDNVTAESTQIKITDLVLSDGTIEDTLNKTITYNFPHNVKQEEVEKEEQEEQEGVKLPNIVVETTPAEQQTQKETVKETPKQLTVESVEKNPVDNTKAQTTIPQTGTTAVGIIIISIIVLLGIVGYIKYRSIELK